MPLVIEIPDQVLLALRCPVGKQAEELKKELALHLYKEGLLPFGPARRLAGMSKLDFHVLLGQRRIPRHYSEEDLKADAAVASQLQKEA
jgi:predicted HTH domain antitoxin